MNNWFSPPSLKEESFLQYLLTTDYYQSKPIFFIYCLSVVYKIRNTASWSWTETRQNLLGSLFTSILLSCGGALWVELGMKGQGLANVISDEKLFIIVAACPLNIVFKMMKFFPIKLTFDLINAWKRTRDIENGIYKSSLEFPTSHFLQLLWGIFYGFGGTLMFPLEGWTRGKLFRSEMHPPSTLFKNVLLSAFLLVLFNGPLQLMIKSLFPMIPQEMFLIKEHELLTLLNQTIKPILPAVNLLSAVVLCLYLNIFQKYF